MEIILEYIKPELLVVTFVLYVIGLILKKSAIVADKHIPVILGILGIALALIYVIATSTLTGYQSILLAVFTAIVQGILVTGASIYANQIWKQLGKDE